MRALLIVGQALARRAVDQRVEVGQAAQRLAGDGDGERAVGRRQVARRPTQRLSSVWPAAQHRIEHLQRRSARAAGLQRLAWAPATHHLGVMKRPKHLKAAGAISARRRRCPSPQPSTDAEPPAGEEDKLDPTRYGDWEKKGIAIDF